MAGGIIHKIAEKERFVPEGGGWSGFPYLIKKKYSKTFNRIMPFGLIETLEVRSETSAS